MASELRELHSYQTRWSKRVGDFLGIRSIAGANFLTFGLPFWAIFNYGFFFHSKFEPENWVLLGTVYLASLWIFLGPIAIVIWEKALSSWFYQLSNAAEESGVPSSAVLEILRPRTPINLALCSFYAVAAVICLNLAIPYINSVLNIEYGTPIYWLTTLVLVQIGYATGLGAAGVLWVLFAYSKISAMDLRWQPFHEDRRGGYFYLIQFLLVTAGLFSAGSIIVPAAVAIGSQSDPTTNLVIVALIGLYSLLIFLSFTVPSGAVIRLISRGRRRYLRSINNEMNRITNEAIFKGSDSSRTVRDDVDSLQKAALLATFYEKITQRSSALVSTPGILRVFVTAALPILAAIGQLVLQFYLQPVLARVLE